MLNFTATYTDQYQLTMAQVYFLKGKNNHDAIFDYFFRKLPLHNGYAVFAGLEDFLNILETLRFDSDDIEFLKQHHFHPDFIDFLKGFRFKGTVYAALEGDLVFPTRPVVSVEANLIEAQIIETLLLNVLNFQTLIATKASRIRQVAGNRQLVDFGLRRAQAVGGYYASRAAIIGGFNATSNVRAGRDYQIPVSGTMSHSFIQSYDNELDAFRDFATIWPEESVFLVDTYDTLKVGVPNAIKVGKEMEKRGHRLMGIRLDSGDLAELAKKSRQMLDDAGLHYVKIAASNQLDEFAIQDLLKKNAPIDLFGVGTSLVIGRPDAALDGVYKLAYSNGKPRIKLSETTDKITLPCKKQVYRLLDEHNRFAGMDLVALKDEEAFNKMHHPFEPEQSWHIRQYKLEPVLNKVFANGERTVKPKSLSEIQQYCQERLSLLPEEYKRLEDSEVYKVGLSEGLHHIRQKLIEEHLEKKA
ncbi:nicotinate phosphoribosyltransferase [Legionella londiniensis]|uniref:Nicotinate phosphoribosyltransferase n=1 Tax=Legionella londiniensis TaxID=45068 RepID=A0A0W0VNH9_9GAMM|nr:nicotinate phosphoribosyltransferase [Legionella londiniensis]KTD21608.1 nicotinate phosphoribosyltransferase [Legionella londiniensis]STX93379.1 nicotinate phosphoribosyltransferase [Legionella londiniensis]